MYNDICETFDNEEFNYYYPISFKDRNKDYLEDKIKVVINWKYGDTVIINIDIPEEETDTVYDKILVKFCNFRYETILEQCYDYSSSIEVPIDKDTSANIFDKGNYYIFVTLVNTELDKCKTIYSEKDLPIYVD